MWEGFVAIDGVEIINVARFEAYADRLGLTWFRPQFKNAALRTLLDHDPYTTPDADLAPWYEARSPRSAEFVGVYPLGVEGADDSTMTSQVFESLGDGGSPSRTRRATKSIVFNAMLVGTTEAGTKFGLEWLKRSIAAAFGSPALLRDGYELQYLDSEPVLGPWSTPGACSYARYTRTNSPVAAKTDLGRSMRACQVTSNAVVTSKRRTKDGCAIWQVTFTIAATNPYEFGGELRIFEDLLSASGGWATGMPITGMSITPVGFIPEVPCGPPSYSPIFDPLLPGVVAPPSVPGVTWGGYTPPPQWYRYQAVLPATIFPATGSTLVPLISITAIPGEVRSFRIRTYVDTDGTGVLDPADVCDFVSDFVVSYIPLGSTLTIDGVDKIVYVDSPDGVRRRADNLVFDSRGTPFKWPEFAHGAQHLLMFDYPNNAPIIDYSLIERIG